MDTDIIKNKGDTIPLGIFLALDFIYTSYILREKSISNMYMYLLPLLVLLS